MKKNKLGILINDCDLKYYIVGHSINKYVGMIYDNYRYYKRVFYSPISGGIIYGIMIRKKIKL
jgi:hypothetical protein